jgi:hypothetical protein
LRAGEHHVPCYHADDERAPRFAAEYHLSALPRHACRRRCYHVVILTTDAAILPNRRDYFRYSRYRSCIRPADWLRPTVS